MTGHFPYTVVALLLIHSHSTDAFYTDYEGRPNVVKEHLRAEKPCKCQCVCSLGKRFTWPHQSSEFSKLIVHRYFRSPFPAPLKKSFWSSSSSTSSKNLSDVVCDLDEYSKRLLCDEVMYNLIYKKHGFVFKSYAKSSDLPVPQIVDSKNLYTCKDIPVKGLDMVKPMYWCRSRRFKKKESPDRGVEEGFFCAASSTDNRRVYLFRPADMDALKVNVMAEVNGYTPDTDAPPSSSPESSSDEQPSTQGTLLPRWFFVTSWYRCQMHN